MRATLGRPGPPPLSRRGQAPALPTPLPPARTVLRRARSAVLLALLALVLALAIAFAVIAGAAALYRWGQRAAAGPPAPASVTGQSTPGASR